MADFNMGEREPIKMQNDRWRDIEINILVDMYIENIRNGKFDGTVRDSEIYKNICEDLARKGFTKSASQIKNKIKSLKRMYKTTKDRLMKSGAGSRHNFKYFDAFDEVLRCRDSTTPKIQCDIGLENIEIPMNTTIGCDVIVSLDEESGDIERNILDNSIEETVITDSPQPSTSQLSSDTSFSQMSTPVTKRSCTEEKGRGRKRKRMNQMEEALRNVMTETTNRILKFEEDAEKAAEAKREAFRAKIIEQNETMIELMKSLIK